MLEQASLQVRERTLAASYYTDDLVLEREKQTLFFKTWQFAGHVSQLNRSGDFFTFTLFDQEIFLIRSDDEEIRGFYNACPHRGHRLLEGAGRKGVISCPYHAWTFDKEGAFIGARALKRTDIRKKSKICLSQVRVETLLDFIFVNFDRDALPLADFAPGLAEQILRTCPGVGNFVLDADGQKFGHTYKCKSNWKVMLDNYLECYHCQNAHPDFNDMMDIPNSKFSLHKNFTHQIVPTANKAENRAFPLDLKHDVLVGNFWFLFPNTTLGQFPGVKGFYVSRFDPVTPHETLRTSTVLKPSVPTDAGAQERDHLRSTWTNEVVAREDQSLCENVQRGLRQKGFEAGWYVTHPEDHGVSEHAMRYFHDLYLEQMGP